MEEYYAFDTTVPADNDRSWNEQKAEASEERERAFRNYFNALAQNTGVADKVKLGGPIIGLAPPRLMVFTDEDTAKKLAAASDGRLFISKPKLH